MHAERNCPMVRDLICYIAVAGNVELRLTISGMGAGVQYTTVRVIGAGSASRIRVRGDHTARAVGAKLQCVGRGKRLDNR